MREWSGGVAIAVMLAAAAAVPASAQTGPDDRIRINVDAGAQFSSIAFDTTTQKPVYLENASIQTSYKVRRGLLADGGIGWRFAGNLGVGLTVSSFMAKDDGAVTASVPHPFFFRTPRTLTGTASGLRRQEIAAHVQAMYTIRASDRVDVVLSAGPSLFRVQQDVVTDIAFADTYPYDAPSFTSASTQRVSGNHVGFNAGADVSIHLSRHAGLGALARFSRATVDLVVPNGGGTVTVDAGGAQVAGGLRLYF